MVAYHVPHAFGIEVDHVKCSKADVFVRHAAEELCVRGATASVINLPLITCAPVEKV